MEGSRRRLVVYVAVGLLPFVFSYGVATRLGAAAAKRVAGEAVAAGDRIAELSTYVPATPLEPTPEAAEIAALRGEPSPKTKAPSGAEKPEAHAAPQASDEPLPKPIGVFVSRQRVLAAADAGIRPSGSPVPATTWRPAGLALSGVGALGVGLRDGDVLTRAGGAATSEGAIVGEVIWALRHRAKAMTGEAWRGRQKIVITVELPELVKVDTHQEPRQTNAP